MKQALSFLALLSVLAPVVPTLSAAPEEKPMAAVPADMVKISLSEQFGIMRLTFSEPMVTAEMVNQPAPENWFRCTLGKHVKTKWLSTSVLSIGIEEKLEPLEIVDISLNHGNVRSLAGHPAQHLSIIVPEHRRSYMVGSKHFVAPDKPILFCSSEHRYDEIVAAAAQNAYYEWWENGKKYTEPAVVHPATIADVLQNREMYFEVVGYQDEFESASSLADSGRAQDEIVPNMWYAEPFGGDVANHEVQLKLPGIGDFYPERRAYGAAEVSTIRIPSFDYMLSNERLGGGEYRVKLAFTLPLNVEDLSEIIDTMPWQFRTGRPGEKHAPLERGEDGVWRGESDFSTVELTPLMEETLAAKKKIRPTADCPTEGVSELYFRAKVTGDRVSLRLNHPFTSAFGKSISEEDLRFYGYYDRDYTLLSSPRPSLTSDLLNNAVESKGKAVLQCEYSALRNMRVQVHRVDADSPQAAILLGKYLEKYAPASPGYKIYWSDSHVPGISTLSEDMWALLPHEERTIEFEGEEGTAEVDLKELFGNESQGMFFVDAGGETFPEWQSDGYMSNQGLVQLTNLGLMWKLSKHSAFVWAYHLSDGQPVPAAQLRLLDAKGKTLATADVKDGIARLPLPQDTAFMQLVEGNDCYTTTAEPRDCDISDEYARYSWYYEEHPEEEEIRQALPRLDTFLFSDRGLYRPGETAHIKGMVRFLHENTLSVPELASVRLSVWRDDEVEREIEAVPEADGSFSADVPLPLAGDCSVQAVCVLKGDADKTSPDMALLVSHDIPEQDADNPEEPHCLWEAVAANRLSYNLPLTVSDFRRNAFEVETDMEVDEENHSVSLSAEALNLTGAPVNGSVDWKLNVATALFCPEAYAEYYFGDYRDGFALDAYYDAYYCGNRNKYDEGDFKTEEGALDEDGQAACSFSLDTQEFPSPVRLRACASVTDGNEQTISGYAEQEWHPCSVYVGISRRECIAEAGKPLNLKTILVTKDGKPYQGAALNAKLTVTRTVVHNYRYGSAYHSDVHGSEEVFPVETRELSLNGVQELTIPTTEAGMYLVDVEGTDADGKRFRTAVNYYVWGGTDATEAADEDDESPWMVNSGTGLRVLASDVAFKPGDTALVLVMTPVDGEVLITVEREDVLRYYRRHVTVGNPVVEVPVEESDAPEVYVSAFLVQTGEKHRTYNGIPMQKLGSTALHVLPVRQTLSVELETPSEPQRPGQECAVSGVVRDADGNPVAGASVTLFAEDEGVLQVIGYKLPDPMECFMAYRRHSVCSYSSLNQLLGEDLAKRDFGNKGVFIGGGGEDDDYFTAAAVEDRTREDFAPCALWLASLRTDENGRFTASFRNPDTLTRYRLMAVCSEGADRFGKGQASYQVDKPVRVEPSAPLTATVGDELELPAQISMNTEEIPAAAGRPLTWKVSLSGTPNAALPQPEQSITLSGAVPGTVMHPVTLTAAGDCRLTWRVQGTEAQAELSDAAAFSVTVRPAMPFLREAVCAVIEPGKSAVPADWFCGKFADETTTELIFSTSPLAGAADGMNYLIDYPHGCVEQLSSGLLPWAFREEMEPIVGLRYPQHKVTETVVAETLRRIMSRQLESGFFSYWQEGNANRNFTPYVALVVSEIARAGQNDKLLEALAPTNEALKEELLEVPSANPVGLYYLAKNGELDMATFRSILAKHAKPDESELWLMAAAAELVKDHAKALELLTQARKAKGKGTFLYGLPSAMAAETLWAVTVAPDSPATARQLRHYVESVAHGSPTTWECGWMCLIIHEYLGHVKLDDRTATLNGQEVSMSKPLHLSVRAGDKTAYTAEGAPVYVSGTAEGYQSAPQPEKMVDKGFAVSRCYEKLNPDGSWTPTATFRVGDVVRVTMRAKHTDALPAVYMALEDRLPAAFEAVNPELTTQALPDVIRTDESNWGGSGFINHREYLKECVRFYVTHWGEGELTASYIARVVKSGKVTAPAAKAELMYRPQVYGLSIPQHFTILPR